VAAAGVAGSVRIVRLLAQDDLYRSLRRRRADTAALPAVSPIMPATAASPPLTAFDGCTSPKLDLTVAGGFASPTRLTTRPKAVLRLSSGEAPTGPVSRPNFVLRCKMSILDPLTLSARRAPLS
jgi:hypothetical protein